MREQRFGSVVDEVHADVELTGEVLIQSDLVPRFSGSTPSRRWWSLVASIASVEKCFVFGPHVSSET